MFQGPRLGPVVLSLALKWPEVSHRLWTDSFGVWVSGTEESSRASRGRHSPEGEESPHVQHR